MTRTIVAATQENMQAARDLAAQIGAMLAPIETSTFPDGEIKVRATGAASRTVFFHRLDRPNEKLTTLFLAAAALRDLGADEIVLVAPYLCYMRQDQAFHKGEAVSQQVIGALISQWVDHIITVEPHLHRIKDLSTVFPSIKVTSLSAAPLLAGFVKEVCSKGETVLVGPDEEALAWTRVVAAQAGVPYVVMKKIRRGDRRVEITLDPIIKIAGKYVYLVDDIVSSGATLCAAAALLKERGAARIEAIAVHALCSQQDLKAIKGAGIARLRSTDTVPHETNAVNVTSLLALALGAPTI